jgi:ATP-dependent exoDNAse (exonuclease V) beta subunit
MRMTAEDPHVAAAVQEDERARRRAADPASNVLLQAPAGSGKTTVLVCRFLALLATAARPEEILAITFTRKAAAEMRERVVGALRTAEAGLPDQARIERPYALAALANARVRGWELLATPARLRIQTIDAFNHGIVARLPVSAGAGAAPEVARAADALYAEAAARTLAVALEDERLGAALALLLDRVDNEWQRLHELLALMLATRAHWLPRVLGGATPDLGARVRTGLGSVLRRELAAAVLVLPPDLRTEAAALAAFAAANLAQRGEDDAAVRAWLAPDAALGAAPADLGRWRLLAGIALTAKGEWRRSITVRNGFAPQPAAMKQRMQAWIEAAADAPGILERLVAVQALPDADLPAEEAEALQSLSQMLQQAAAELLLVFAERGQLDYAQVAGAARAALSFGGAPTDLALRLGSAVRHILVDEFQDTSAEQISLLRALTAGWEEGDGRTLFAVGDPMQSIYQFREADVGLYLRARDRGIGERAFEPLALHRNFRSGPGIVAWVNQVFGRIFPQRDDPLLSGVAYLESTAACAEPAGSVQVHGRLAEEPEAEAARVLGIVQAARRRDPAACIAVLVANRSHAIAPVAALRAAGIAVRGVKLEPLGERAVVRDLATLARALQHIGDRTAWLALLRAPWCGLRLDALAALGADAAAPLWQVLQGPRTAVLGAEERARAARVVRALEPALAGGERALPLAERVERCWQRLGGPAIHAALRDQDDAESFLDALAADPATELLAGEALQALAQDAYASARSQPGAVDVLTMHAAKGLEWDVVIVPGLGRRNARDPEPLLHWIEFPNAGEEPDLLLAPLRATGEPVPRSVAAYIRGVRRQRQQLERVRLLYVTATRARRELHWLGAATPVDDGGVCRPVAGSLLQTLWPALREQFTASLGPTLPAAPAAAPPGPPPLLRVPAGWEPAWPAALALSRLPLSLAEPGSEPEYSWVGLAARAVGTIVHAELQRLTRGGETAAAAVRNAQFYRAWLAEFGVPEAERAAAAGRVRAALERTLADPRGQWLLDNRHAQAGSEVRLSGIEGGRIVSVVFDRSFVDADGARWIIDYKTSTHAGGGTLEFLASEAERYRPQLARYAALARHLGPEPVRTALYFPLLGAFREIGPASETAGE